MSQMTVWLGFGLSLLRRARCSVSWKHSTPTTLDGFILTCYATDVVIRHGDRSELIRGHDGMRRLGGPFINDPGVARGGREPACSQGTGWSTKSAASEDDGRADALVAYEVYAMG